MGGIRANPDQGQLREIPDMKPETDGHEDAPATGLRQAHCHGDSGTPTVTVVIPCRNEQRHIEQCLRTALGQVSPSGDFEVVVADGMSDDDTRALVEQVAGTDHRVRLIDNPRHTVSAGLNAAIRLARGQIIVRMDAHTEYAPDYLQQCVRVLEETGATNVGGPARTKADTYAQRAVAAAYHSPFSAGGARFHDVNYEGYVDTVTYGCWRREAFEQFGYFDEELVRNQDDEHNLRIIRGGGKVYQSPDIRSWYHPRGSLGALLTQYMQYGYWKVRVIQKHKLPASWRHLVPGAFLLALMLLFLFSALSSLSARVVSPSNEFVAGNPTFSYPHLSLFLILAAYALALFVASLVTAARFGLILFPMLPFVFPCYHFGYGFGFLRGVWDFIVCRRQPKAAFTQLTR